MTSYAAGPQGPASQLSQRYVVIDFETSGLSPRGGHRVIEVAAVEILAGKIGETYQSLVSSGIQLSEKIFQLTGISNTMLRGAPPAEKIMREFADFTDGAILVAHNAAFDRRFLEAELALLGIHRDHRVLCTLQLSRKAFPNAESYKLADLVAHAGIQASDRYHRALADAEVTAKLFLKIQDVLQFKIQDHVEELDEVNPTVVGIFEEPELNTPHIPAKHDEASITSDHNQSATGGQSPQEVTYQTIVSQIKGMTPRTLTGNALDDAITLVEFMRDEAIKRHDANEVRSSELDERERALNKRARDLSLHERAVAAVLKTAPHAVDERIKTLIDRENALAIREAEFVAIKKRAVEKSLGIARPGDAKQVKIAPWWRRILKRDKTR